MKSENNIKLDPENVRLHDEKNKNAIEGSLKQCGAGRSIVMDSDNYIIGGNGVYEQAQKMGIPIKIIESDGKELFVIKRTDLKFDDPKRKALAVSDNRSGDLSSFNDAELAKMLDALKAEDFDLSAIGFDDADLKAITNPLGGTEGQTDPDDVPEAPKEPKSETGKIYQCGRHRVMCGDSTKADDVARLMDGNKSEMLFTSPPYSNMREYSGNDVSVSTISDFISAFATHCNYLVFNLGIQRKEHSIIEYWVEYLDKAKKTGKKFLAWNVWWKNAISIGQQSAFMPIEHEWVFVFGDKFKDINRTEARATERADAAPKMRRQKDGSTKRSSAGKSEDKKELGSVLNTNPELGSIRSEHPATFPVIFPEKYILAISDGGHIIADPFLGSGTTMIAAEKTGRICYGLEISPVYVDVIRKRWAEFVHGKDCDWEKLTPEAK